MDGSNYSNLKSGILTFLISLIIYGACTQGKTAESSSRLNFTINGDNAQPNVLLGKLNKADSNLCYKALVGEPICFETDILNEKVEWSINGKGFKGNIIQFKPEKAGFYEVYILQKSSSRTSKKCLYIRPILKDKLKSEVFEKTIKLDSSIASIPKQPINLKVILPEDKDIKVKHEKYYKLLNGESCKDLKLSICNSAITKIERVKSHNTSSNNVYYYNSKDDSNKFKNRIACNEAEIIELLQSSNNVELTIEYTLLRMPGENCQDAKIIKILAVSSNKKDIFKKDGRK